MFSLDPNDSWESAYSRTLQKRPQLQVLGTDGTKLSKMASEQRINIGDSNHVMSPPCLPSNLHAGYLSNGILLNLRALALPTIGEQKAKTLCYDSNGTIVVTIFSHPQQADQTRLKRVFMCDRNAPLRACMEFVVEYWPVPMVEVNWIVMRGYSETPWRVFPEDRVEDVLADYGSALEIFMEIPNPDVIHANELMDWPSRTHNVGHENRCVSTSRSLSRPVTNWALVLVHFQELITSQLQLDADKDLKSLGDEIASNFGKDMITCQFFQGEEAVDNESTLASLQLPMNHSIRMYDCGNDRFEFYL